MDFTIESVDGNVYMGGQTVEYVCPTDLIPIAPRMFGCHRTNETMATASAIVTLSPTYWPR